MSALNRPAILTMVAVFVTLAACGPAQSPLAERGSDSVPLKQMVLRVADERDDPDLAHRFGDGSGGGINYMINAFLARTDDRGVLGPYLTVKLPSQDDGTWVISPDGTMQTIWTIRPDARWHDGQPLTSHDIVFAHKVYLDNDIPVPDRTPERYISSITPRDDRTFEVNWRQLFFGAAQPREPDLEPLPRHLLEDLYNTSDKQAFVNHRFWTTEEYVGLGPYRVAKREQDVRVTLAANPYFFLGTPRIDIIEFTFSDQRAVVARLLAGDIDFAEHAVITTEQAAVLRDQWNDANEGKVFSTMWQAQVLVFQQADVPVDPQPALRDVRVRRALIHAVDREAIGSLATNGFSMATDVNMTRTHLLFQRMEAAAAKYAYDIRRAEQLLNEAGWVRGTDGMVHNAAGTLLDLQMYGSPRDAGGNIPAAFVDFWKRVGIDAKVIQVSRAQHDDPQYRANFPGAQLQSKPPFQYHDLIRAELPTEQNRWNGRNVVSWVNQEYEAAFARFSQSLSLAEREEMAVELERVITMDVGQPRLFYQVRPGAARNNVEGIKEHSLGHSPTYLWNILEWRVT